MRRIPLTKGKEALVDDKDYQYLMQWKWHAATGGQYAARDGRSSNRRHGKLIYMHRVVAERMGLVACANRRGRQTYCLGRFDDPRLAARAYIRAAIQHFGEFAVLNPL
jgi:hypothetical protein